MNEELSVPLTDLAQTREFIVEKKVHIATLNEELSKTSLSVAIALANGQLEELTKQAVFIDQTIRERALTLYDGENKTILDGVKIVDTTEVEFLDDAKIIAWASEHSQKSLSYKKAAIKKIVKGGGMDVDGTRIIEGNAVRITSDLSVYLDG